MLQGVVGAALAIYETCYPKITLRDVSSDRLSGSSQDCLRELFEWRSFETMDGIVAKAMQDGQSRVSHVAFVVATRLQHKLAVCIDESGWPTTAARFPWTWIT